ncbi:unnamed protein product [Tuber aestivum]|uniref:Uncharacterized protein n=1 Tax=Tuber aestivum TaxID=59557 RepID=A0A292PLU6_9PEZI|nr:unnamed protein product [Tuber aestivum]
MQRHVQEGGNNLLPHEELPRHRHIAKGGARVTDGLCVTYTERCIYITENRCLYGLFPDKKAYRRSSLFDAFRKVKGSNPPDAHGIDLSDSRGRKCVHGATHYRLYDRLSVVQNFWILCEGERCAKSSGHGDKMTSIPACVVCVHDSVNLAGDAQTELSHDP